MVLAVSNDLAEAEQLFRDDPEMIHATNSLGETPLHYLAIENDLEAVDWLRREGASIDTTNDFGKFNLGARRWRR